MGTIDGPSDLDLLRRKPNAKKGEFYEASDFLDDFLINKTYYDPERGIVVKFSREELIPDRATKNEDGTWQIYGNGFCYPVPEKITGLRLRWYRIKKWFERKRWTRHQWNEYRIFEMYFRR